jgi:hypothetical protein
MASEIRHNFFLKYEPYFKKYSFIRNFELKCKLLLRDHLSDGKYDYFGDSLETMRHGTYGIVLSISPNKVLTIFEGSWASDSYHGKGYLYTVSHPSSEHKMLRLMEGEWSNGMLHGKGAIKYFDLAKEEWQVGYEGTFKNGEKWGFGVERDANSLYRGEFSKGCRTGKGRLEDKDGNFFDGVFEKGFLIGESYESVGDAFIITDANYKKKVYRKP